MKVHWTTPAHRDLESIVDFLLERNPPAARRIAGRIWARVQSLAEMPSLGRLGRIDGTRELVIADTPFVVVYRVIAERIEILAVYHGARRWPDSL